MHESRDLATYVGSVKLADIPDDVVRQVKRLILDQFGCQISGSRLPWCEAVHRSIRNISGSGPCSVVAQGDKLPVDEAAFVNSTFGHGNEIDDTHVGVRTHAGAVVIPAAVSTAEMLDDVDGGTLLAGITVGYEVMLRVGRAAMPDLAEVRHHHTPVATGPFGAAAAAARVLRLDPAGAENALSIAASHSGGLMQYTQTGGSVKRIHTAIPAKAGIRAALLARDGITGPGEILEGKRGFLEAFAGSYDRSQLSDGLGSTFMVLGVGIKRYNANYRIHAPLDALLSLMESHTVAFDQIAAMRVGVSSATLNAVGTIIDPADTVAAQFSLRFALALVAKSGSAALRDIGPGELSDPDVQDLARRITLYLDAEQEAVIWTSFGAVLTIETADGKSLTERMGAPIGSPELPISDREVEQKFRSLATPVCGAAAADAIVSAVWSLEQADLRRDLWPYLFGAPQ